MKCTVKLVANTDSNNLPPNNVVQNTEYLAKYAYKKYTFWATHIQGVHPIKH